MRNLTLLLICLCLLISATTTMAGLKGDSLAFQGRLTDASDNPVPDGPRDLTLSLWTDPVGGTMLHSEVVVVTVSKGLYSTCIGCTSSSFFDIFTDQSVYLQVQLAGSPPMTPRTTMRSVPFSVSSSGVHGEATNGAAKAKGIISVKSASGSGSMTNGKFLLDADSDGDGVAEASDSSGVSEEAAGRRLQVHNLGSSGEDGVEITPISAGRRLAVHNLGSSGQDGVEISSAVTPSSASQIAAITAGGVAGRAQHSAVVLSSGDVAVVSSNDLDGDGLPENEISQMLTPTTSSMAIKTKGTGAAHGRSSVSGTANDTGTVVLGELDTDDDGDPNQSFEQRLTPTTSSMAIKTKGTGAAHNRVITTTTTDSVGTEQTFEFTNSLLMPALMKAKEKANRTKCSNNLRYQSPIANNEAEFSVDSAGSGLAMSADSDGDGIPEAKLVGKIVAGTFSGGPGTVSLQMADIDDDGIPESEISHLVTPTTSGVAIKVKGTGAEKNRTAGSSCDDSLAIDYLDIDDDGDGISEAHAVSSVSSIAGGGGGAAAASYAATGRWYTDSDDDGVPEGDIDAMVTPTASYVAIKTKGTGAANNRSSITSTTDTAGASSVLAVDLDGDGLADRSVTMDCDDTDGGITVEGASSAVKIKHKGWDGLIYGRMAIETGGAIEVDFGGNGVGFVSQRFGVGVLSPTHPFEHSSGAHLTAGGVWTNASDENLKENFRTVDGADLLEKIEQLPISEWNYKNESDESRHIGPTAQDFQETFGVGSDGKSISTIDPSGIALAAIKELNNKINTQNQTLSQENKQLRKEMDELKKMVQELAKSK